MKIQMRFLLLTFLLVSCELSEVNVNPVGLADATLSQILPGLLVQAAFNTGNSGPRMCGIIMQHFSGNDAQQLPFTKYQITENDLHDYWGSGLYAGAMKDCRIVIDKATSTKHPHYEGIALVIMAESLGMATSFWGDVPYSQALQIDKYPNPAYDTQEEIYQTIQNLLDSAIIAFSKPDASDLHLGYDLIYNGDMSLWTKVARSLKARYYLHLSMKGASNVQRAIDQIRQGALSSNDDEPLLNFSTEQIYGGPYFQFGLGRPGTLEIAPSFVTRLTITSDPRKPNIIDSDGRSFYSDSNAKLYWSQPETPLPLISFSEVKFIEAELKLRLGDEAGAESAMAEGIRANMERLGINDVPSTTYIASKGNFSGLNTFDQKMERIIEEKYVSMYAQGPVETWVDYRRTGYPVLIPSSEGDNGLNPGGQIPKRFLYDALERTSNEKNVNAAKERQGGDLMNVPLWAFTN